MRIRRGADKRLSARLIKKHIVNKDLRSSYIKVYSVTDSTNTQARNHLQGVSNCTTPMLFVADRQTSGRGTKGRTFVSEGGVGLYMSVTLPLDDDACDMLTVYAAVCVCEALSLFGVYGEIKWVNDITYNGKKLCGILTERLTLDGVGYAIIGIGINLYARKSWGELGDIAGDVESSCGVLIPRSALAAKIYELLVTNLRTAERGRLIEKYKERSCVLGRELTVSAAESVYTATAVDIDSDGALIVMRGGESIRLVSADVSVRLN